MSNRINCPNGHVLAVTQAHEGKKIKCPKCQVVFQVPLLSAVQAPTSAPAAAPAQDKQRVQAQPPKLDRARFDEDEQDERPRKRPHAEDEEDEDRPRKRRRDDDEEDEDRPRRRDRDEEDEDEDRPRKKRRDDGYADEEDDEPRGRRRDEEEDEEFDEKREKKLRKAQKGACRVGMVLFFVRYLTAAICYAVIVFAFLLVLLAGLVRSPGIAQVAGIFGLIGWAVLMFIVPIVGVVGGAFMLRSPPKSGARGLGIASLALDAAILLCIVLYLVTVGAAFGTMMRGDLFGAERSVGLMLLWIVLLGLCFLAGFIVNMLMFRMVALYVKDKFAAGQCITLMIVYLAVGIGGFIVWFILNLLLVRAGVAGGIISLAILVGLFVTLTFTLFRIAFTVKSIKDQL